DAGLANQARSKRLDRLAAGWNASARNAFTSLRTAAQAYAKSSGDNEVDLSGTARAALAFAQEQHLYQVFTDLLAALGDGRLPLPDATPFQAQDAAMNDVYRRIRAIKTPPNQRGAYSREDSLPFTTVTRHCIRGTQRSWLRYRDAWI